MFKKETRPSPTLGITILGWWSERTGDDPELGCILLDEELILQKDELDVWGGKALQSHLFPLWSACHSEDQRTVHEVVFITTSQRRIIEIRGADSMPSSLNNGEDEHHLGLFAEASPEAFELLRQQLER